MSPALASSGASIELALYAGSKWFGSNRVFFPPPPYLSRPWDVLAKQKKSKCILVFYFHFSYTSCFF
jgi:hypothetical protein